MKKISVKLADPHCAGRRTSLFASHFTREVYYERKYFQMEITVYQTGGAGTAIQYARSNGHGTFTDLAQSSSPFSGITINNS